MVSVTSASRYVTSVSHYQSRCLMYIQGLIPRNFTELAEAVPIAILILHSNSSMLGNFSCFCCHQLTFLKTNFFPKNYLRNTISVSNSLDPDQDQHSKLFAKVISRQQKSLLTWKKLKAYWVIFHTSLFVSGLTLPLAIVATRGQKFH